jgi:hypothetical protein
VNSNAYTSNLSPLLSKSICLRLYQCRSENYSHSTTTEYGRNYPNITEYDI